MNTNLLYKTVFILIVVVLALLTLYPPSETLKPGIDLAGGSSITLEINTQGLKRSEQDGLSQKMITVLRRRIDPANIQNLVWRPQGNTRFEIQMPLANAKAREMREAYEMALDALLNKNISTVRILQSLKKDETQRTQDFAAYAQDDPNRLKILTGLAKIRDERDALQKTRDDADAQLNTIEKQITDAGMNLQTLQTDRIQLINQEDPNLTEYQDPNLVKAYLAEFSKWNDAVIPLATPETGVNARYVQALRELDKLSLSSETVSSFLDLPDNSSAKKEAIAKAKTDFADRADLITAVIEAFNAYRPHRGSLDDPKDLLRMLKGAGVLEFRILPTYDGQDLPQDEQAYFVESLKAKGPKEASTAKYIWCELEDSSDEALGKWVSPNGTRGIVGKFGGKRYVLACKEKGKTLLRSSGEKPWKLERAAPSSDDMGRRAIAFSLNERGAVLFAKLTGDNIERPLCILLDDIAITAPNISTRIAGSGIITGTFTNTEVEDMVNKLNAGSLPARLIEQPISIKTIGPSIGEENRTKGVKAGFIGLFVVIACMVVYYLKAGAIANVALVMNILIVLALMAGLDATFTLPGIAGIILTIGMSVDANVLIFERIREEQTKGSSLRVAIKNGYERAFRTILDANLTTFITAAILYWVASEEIKGFAIVLMLGIGSSMFTALFVTRVIFEILQEKNVIKGQLKMLRLIHQPQINWMGLRKVFFCVSSVLILSGLLIFFTRDSQKNNKYDIEFTGGTSVLANFTNELTTEEVKERLVAEAVKRGSPALEAAHVYRVGEDPTQIQFEIITTETNKTAATVIMKSDSVTTEQAVKAIERAQGEVGGRLSNLRVEPGSAPNSLAIATSQVNAELVKNVLQAAFPDDEVSDPQVDEIVNNTIMDAFGTELALQHNLKPTIVSAEQITEALVQDNPILIDSLGGIKIECQIEQGATGQEIDSRIRLLRSKPNLTNLHAYPHTLFGADLSELPADKEVKNFVFVSLPDDAGLRELSTEEWTKFEDNEKDRVLEATSLEASLPRVTQIDPSVGGEQKTRALIAIFLSLSAIIAYIWVRFGNFRYGLAAIAALVHDVCITLGAVTACAYFAGTTIGDLFLIGDFKINLAMIAAFLTLIGYSLNDTIVVFDRIRENRLKAQLNAQTITNSINQTISRTILTSFTTFIVVLVMYIFGGEGLRGFTFAIGCGVIVGTYSSIAIAAPILLIGEKIEAKLNK